MRVAMRVLVAVVMLVIMLVMVMMVVVMIMIVVAVRMSVRVFVAGVVLRTSVVQSASAIFTHYSISNEASSISRPARKSVLTAAHCGQVAKYSAA